jgi:lia operon protein LiaF
MTTMRIGAKSFGLLLVLGGLLYLLDKLDLLQGWGLAFTPGVIWPLLLAFAGVSSLGRGIQYGKVPWFSIYLIVLGLLLALRNSHLVAALQNVGGWSLFWSLSIIFMGLSLLWPKRSRWPRVRAHVNNNTIDIGVDELVRGWRAWKPNKQSTWRWIGDISIGRQAWTLKDTDLWNAVGDVRVNLATAHVEDGTYRITVGGWVGDVRILVPESLAVSVNAYVGLGDMVLFEERQSGTGRRLHYVDPQFNQAARRVIIDIDLKIGDVQVVRV